jgi:hypothetical protein
MSKMNEAGMLTPDPTDLAERYVAAAAGHADGLSKVIRAHRAGLAAIDKSGEYSEKGKSGKRAAQLQEVAKRVRAISADAAKEIENEIKGLRSHVPAHVPPPKLDSEFDAQETIPTGPERSLARELRKSRVDARLREIRQDLRRMDRTRRDAEVRTAAAEGGRRAQELLAAVCDSPTELVHPDVLREAVSTYWSGTKPELHAKLSEAESALGWLKANLSTALERVGLDGRAKERDRELIDVT